ncbi:MAG: InlB B-repeat-containing protein [Eggerthella lenta]
MLEKMLDLKNTFEGKFLAVLMSVVLVMSMTNILAFAGNEGQKDGSKTESAPTDQVVGESDKEAVDEAVQHGESAAAKDADASKTTPSQPLVSTTVDEAVVTFETQNAFVSVKDQLLSGTMLTTELHKELRFAASADTGFELGAITAKNAANADVPVTTQDGVSSIAAEYVDSTLVVSVVAAAVVSDEPEVETTPITSDTKIEPGEADEKGEPEEPKSEEPETDEPEAPVADEDVVEVEADVSNPAVEGYAQAGNVLVKVTAAEGVLPEGATVQATRIERQDVVDAVAERVESQGKVLEDAIAIDVTLLDKDGNEIQPNGALNVCFFDANVEGEEVGVYRVSDDASQVETIGARQADPAVQSFDVDHFTIYVVGTYTKAESYDKAYEVAPGGTVELEANNRSSKYGAWSIEGSGQLISSNNNKTPTAKVKINNNASNDSFVTVSYRTNLLSYDRFYIKVVSSSSTKVTFDLNGGTGTAPKAVEGENYVTLPGQDGFSRNGYEFLGWSTARDASTVTEGSAAAKVYPAGSEYYLEKNTTLYAVWGAVSTNNKDSVKIAIRTDGTIPDEPSIQKAGYQFLTNADTGMIMVPSNWFSPLHTTAGVDNVTPMLTDAFWEYVNGQNIGNRYWNSETEYVQFYVIKWQVDGGVKPYVGATTPGYAWHIDGVVKKKDKVTLTYSGNGPYEGLIPDSTEHVAGEQVAVKGQNWTDASGTSREFSRPGYTFAGWNTQPNGSGDQYNAGETLTMNGNVTLYAQWVPKDKVTINYVALSGGTVEPGHEYLNPDLDDAKGSVAKAKAGYVFGGWYDNEACSDRPVGENERFTPTRPDSGWADGTTYYAKFVAERTAYTVNHYKVNAAHTAATLDNAENLNATTDAVVEATAQTIPGYTYQPLFDENGMKTVASGTVAGDGSLVLNLYYTPDADALAYHANGGQGTMAATEGVTDQVVEVAANGFERAGYAFVGWNTAADGSGQAYAAGAGYALTAGDDALFAQWTANFTDLAATGFEVTYDGGTHIVQISGTILPSDIVEYWSGDTKLAANEFVNVVDSAEVTVKVIRGGQTWTSDPVVAKINPVAVAINVNSDTKVYNADDPVFSGTVSKLVSESDLGEITYGRLAADASKENVGDDITLTAFYTENDNYNVTVINGKLVITPSDENAIVATGITKTYDGRTASIVANAAQPDSTIEYSVDGQSWTAINPVFINVGTYTVQVRATKPNYESVSASADVVVNPATITVTANNQTKIAGETDPELTYTFAGAVNDEIARFAGGLQREAGEEAGVYAINQGDLVLVDNGAFRIANYTLEFASGTFTITAAPVMPPTPPTPPTPPASPTPTPLPTPGAVPPDSPIAPVVTPIVDALQGAAEAVIGDNETPLAEPRETEIGDNGTPLASHDHASCWVHWYIILGIMVTALYGACVALRRGLFSRKLKKYEDGLTGGGDPAPGAPSISDDASAPIAPKGAPAGATLAAGLGE